MTNIEIEGIMSQIPNLKNIQNSILETHLEKLSTEFDKTKNNIISLTYHLDTVEELYNKILEEYKTRVND